MKTFWIPIEFPADAKPVKNLKDPSWNKIVGKVT